MNTGALRCAAMRRVRALAISAGALAASGAIAPVGLPVVGLVSGGVLVATAAGPAWATTPTEQDPLTARREVDLATKLRCLVCQNQSIAESNAELAQDLRRQIREQIAAGKSDAEIIDFMTARYGDFVLYRPPFKASTLLLWLGPLGLLVAGAAMLARMIRARRASVTEADLTPEQQARAARLLAGEPGEQA
jgi:cytochrome c-type biogenesis protein CcmH